MTCHRGESRIFPTMPRTAPQLSASTWHQLRLRESRHRSSLLDILLWLQKFPQGTGASSGGGEWVWARKTRLWDTHTAELTPQVIAATNGDSTEWTTQPELWYWVYDFKFKCKNLTRMQLVHLPVQVRIHTITLVQLNGGMAEASLSYLGLSDKPSAREKSWSGACSLRGTPQAW